MNGAAASAGTWNTRFIWSDRRIYPVERFAPICHPGMTGEVEFGMTGIIL